MQKSHPFTISPSCKVKIKSTCLKPPSFGVAPKNETLPKEARASSSKAMMG